MILSGLVGLVAVGTIGDHVDVGVGVVVVDVGNGVGNGVGPVICSPAGQEVLCLVLYYQRTVECSVV